METTPFSVWIAIAAVVVGYAIYFIGIYVISRRHPRYLCPACGCRSVRTKMTPATRYWASADGPRVVVDVPVRQCNECEYWWTDKEAEKIWDAAMEPLRRGREPYAPEEMR